MENVKKEIEKVFNPKSIEDKLYSFWEKNGFFEADENSNKKPFSIVMPPPNVTGSLHMGHALVSTLQDIIVRYKRMAGFETLWIPGLDHAGISTQTVVEKNLMKKFGKRKTDFSKEEFISQIWKWKEEKQEQIIEQIKKLGCSCDWNSLQFTMDEKSNIAVNTLFKKLFDQGLLYRGDYLVNWDTITQTALADDEVEYEEQNGFLWYFKYPIANEKEYITIATTRPETMLGDTAVAVSPKDPRFFHLKKKYAILPILNKKIPIIEDSLIDPKFGSGAVKITPAHDHIDYEIGKRHNLEIINIMTPDGKINKNGKKFANLKMLQARELIVKEMKKLGLLEKIEPYKIRIGFSYRSKAIIEPYLSKQWFIKMGPFKQKLIDAVKNKKVKIIPSHWEENYFYWIKNLKDWCISRQLWWGHPIPVWHNKKDPNKMICQIEKQIPLEIEKDISNWYKDEDVLDTWFSSALWPFSTLSWPKESKKFKKFYPQSLLITGHDILFFWVARMVMMGEYATGKTPFEKVFLHGLIYSKSYWEIAKDGSIIYISPEDKNKKEKIFSKWEKMSKTKGNIIDPIEMIQKYGTDTIRITLSNSTTNARQIDLDQRKFQEFQHFINKIWNGFRFIFQNISNENNLLTTKDIEKGIDEKLLTLEDKWILSRLNKTIKNTFFYLENFNFDKSSSLLYKFFWDEFCAYYLEIVKPILKTDNKKNKQKLLVIILLSLIRLMHPFIPFITEEIFLMLKEKFKNINTLLNADKYTKDVFLALKSPSCMVCPYPNFFEEDISQSIEEKFENIKEIIKKIRNIRSSMKIELFKKIDIYIFIEDKNFQKELQKILFSLIKIKNLYFNKTCLSKIKSSFSIQNIKVTIPLPKDLEKNEKKRLLKDKEILLKDKNHLEKKLANENFIKNAPEEIKNSFQQKLEKTNKNLQEIEEKLKNI